MRKLFVLLTTLSSILAIQSAYAQVNLGAVFTVQTIPDSIMYLHCSTSVAPLQAAILRFGSPASPVAATGTSNYFVDTVIAGLIDTAGSTTVNFTNNTWNTTTGRINLATLNFNFCFYGTKYDYAFMSDNGYVFFTNTANPANITYSNAAMPNTGSPRPAVFGCFKDFQPALNGRYSVKVVGTAPSRYIVFNFNAIRNNTTCNSSAYDHTFQIILYETTNIIEVRNSRITSCNASDNATCAIQNATGTAAVAANHYDGSITTRNFDNYSLNTATKGNNVRFVPNGATGGSYAFNWFDVTNNTQISTNLNHTVTGLSAAVLPRKYVARLTYTACNGTNTTITDTITVRPPNITATIDTIRISCIGNQDGKIRLKNITGGTPPFTCSISPAPAGSSITYSADSISIDGLSGSTACTQYTLTVTDATGCTKTLLAYICAPAPVVITQPPTILNNIPCNIGAPFVQTVQSTSGNAGAFTYSFAAGPSITTMPSFTFGPPAGYTGWVAPAVYTITATDSKGCTATKVVTTNRPPAINVTPGTPVDILCGTGTGSFSYSRTGGFAGPPTPPAGSTWFTYTLNPSVGTLAVTPVPGNPGSFPTTSTASHTNLPYGTYTATVTDYRTCSASTIFTIDTFGVPVLTIDSIVHLKCHNVNQGKVGVTAVSTTSKVGHVYTYTYTLNNGSSSVNNTTGAFTNLAPGNYTVTVADNKGCTKSTTLTITQPPALTVSSTFTKPPSCYNTQDAIIVAAGNGGTGALSLSISPTAGTFVAPDSFKALPPNSYTVSATDANGCVATTAVNIVAPGAISLAHTSYPPKCVGESNGFVVLTPTGGTPPFTYSTPAYSSSINNADTVKNLPAGTYTVQGTDANGCTSQITITINPAVAITATAVVDSATCFKACNGVINVTALGGVGGFSYALDNGSFVASKVFVGVCAGTHTITVSDANACTQNFTFTVYQPDSLYVVVDSVRRQSCAGLSDASVWYTVVGGTPPFTTPAMGNGPLVQLTPRTFRNNGISCDGFILTTTDAKNCTVEWGVNVPCTPDINVNTINTTSTTCANTCNGSVTVSAIVGGTPFMSTGTPRYTLRIDSVRMNPVTCITTPATYGPSSTFNISGLGAGNYYARVLDSLGCFESITFTIVQPDTVKVTATNTVNATCFGLCNGIAKLAAVGGTGTYTYSGAPVFNLDSAKGLCAGTTYTIFATDGNSCSGSTTVSVTQPTQIQLPNVFTAPACNGNCNGFVVMNESGGTGTITFTSSFGTVVLDTIKGLCANVPYTITATDANSCTATTSVTLTQPSVLNISASITNVQCNATASGSATLSATGGNTGGYTYSIAGGAATISSNVVSGLANGITYTATVTDTKGCTSQTTITVTQPAELQLNQGTVVPVACKGQSNGSFTYTTTGGTLPYSYTGTSSGLAAGTYTFAVNDGNNCKDTITVVITEPDSLLTFIPYVKHPSCFGSTNGAAGSTVTGGNAPYNYIWNSTPPQANDSLLNVGAGAYCITVTDSKGCTTSRCVTLTQPADLSLPNITVAASCFGTCNGIVNMNVAGGTASYVYQIAPNAGVTWSNDSAFGLCAGTSYVVTVTDAQNCTKTTTVSVAQPAALAVSVIDVDSTTCFGASNGAAIVSVSGGTTPYTYQWNSTPTQSTATLTGVPAGIYTCTITDAKNCVITTSVTIHQPAAVQFTGAVLTHVACFGTNTGAVTFTVVGGTGPGTYTYNLPTTSLAQGTYVFTATDGKGCVTTSTVTITQPSSAVSISIPKFGNPTCSPTPNGSIAVLASGGTPGYTYYRGNTFATATIIPTPNDTAKGLSAGTYTLWAQDANGCTASITQTLINASAPTLSATVDSVDCYATATGAATITVSGGKAPFNYTWSCSPSTTNTASGLVAGSCAVTVIDSAQCSATINIVIAQPDSLNISSVVTHVACFGGNTGAINASVTGGTLPYTYTWTGTSSTTGNATGLSAGSYTLQVTDAKGCTKSVVYTITQNPQLGVSVSTTHVSCFGGNNGSVVLTGSGGTGAYTYSPSQTGLTQGTYVFTITDANVAGCTTTTSVTITQPANALSISIPKFVNPTCNPTPDGTIAVLASGGTPGYTYYRGNTFATATIIPTPNDTAKGLSAGTYTLWAQDANGCTASTTQNLINASAPTLSATIDSVDCYATATGAATITVSGGKAPFNYTWSCSPSTTNTASGLVAGSCAVTVIDSAQCSATINIVIAQPDSLNISSIVTHVACFGGNTGAINASVTGGTLPYTYTWTGTSSSTSNATGLSAGSYTLQVTDAKGCTKSVVYTITQNPQLGVSVSTTHVSCFGGNNGSVVLTGSGGTGAYTYSPSQTGLTQGTYVFTITDANVAGCTTTTSVTITQPPTALGVNALVTAAPSCIPGSDGIVTLSSTGGTGTVTFRRGPIYASATAVTNVVTGLSAGVYTFWVTDANGCTASTTALLASPGAPTGTVAVSNVLCPGACTGTATVTATSGVAPFTYAWSCPNNSSTSNVATNLCAGACSVTITDAVGCAAVITFTINQPPPFIFDTASYTVVNPTSSLLCNGSITVTGVTGGTPPYQYQMFSTTGANAPSGWQSSNVFNNLCANVTTGADTIIILVRDASNCPTTGLYDTMFVYLTAPTGLAAIASTFDELCDNYDNGEIIVNAFGSLPPYTYSISPAVPFPGNTSGAQQETISYANVPPGTYTVVVTAANGDTVHVICTVAQAIPLNVTVTGASATCTSPANITVSGSGGSGILSTIFYDTNYVQQYGPLTVPTTTTVVPNKYYVVTYDANLCADTTLVILDTAVVLSFANVTSTPATCYGPDGCISFNVVNGSGSLLLAEDPNPPAPFTGSYNSCTYAPGTYTFTVTDATGCSASTTVIVAPSVNPTITLINAVNANCYGDSTGYVSFTASGVNPLVNSVVGTAVTSITNTTANSVLGLKAGTFIITTTDATTGCTSSISGTIGQSSQLTLSLVGNNPLTNGASNGSIVATTTGGTGFPTTTILPGGSFTGLAAGCYTVQATDIYGCTTEATICLVNPSSILCNVTPTNVSCNGLNNGSFVLNASGGVGTLTWSSSIGSGTTYPYTSPNNIAPGTYVITVTDANAATCVTTLNITEPSAVVASIATTTPTGCAAPFTAIGSATGSATGGTGSYSYSWIGSSSVSATASNLAAGTYSFIATDNSGCADTAAVTIGTSANPTLSISGTTTALCAGDSTGTVTFNTSAPSYSATITGPATTSVTTQLLNVFGGLQAGNFTITVTNAATGCSASVAGNIAATPALGITTIGNNTSGAGLNDGSITVNLANGAPTYTVIATSSSVLTSITMSTTGPGTISGLGAGQYTVCVIDANLCSSCAITNIYAPGQLIPIVTATSNVSCYGEANGSVTLTASGGVPFGASNYQFSIAGPGAPTITSGQVTNAVAGNLQAGVTYTVTIQDANAITAQTTISVGQPALLVANAAITVPITCTLGATVNVTASGGNTGALTLTWNGVAQPYGTPITNVAVGTYAAVVTDSKGCTAQTVIDILPPTLPIITSVQQSPSNCVPNNSGSFTVTASGGNGSLFYGTAPNPSSASNVISNLPSGSYTIYVQDAYGCVSTTSSTIGTTDGPTITSVVIQNAQCSPSNTGAITVLAATGASSTLYYGTAPNPTNTNNVLSGLTAGSYTVHILDGNGCTATASAIIGTAPNPSITAISTTTATCTPGSDGSAEITAGGAAPIISYATTSGAGVVTGNTVNNLALGIYTFIVTDANGCTATSSASITNPSAPVILNTVIVPTQCSINNNVGSITLTMNFVSGGSATISPSATITTVGNTVTATGLTNQAYNIAVTDANGCTVNTVIVCPVTPAHQIIASSITSVSCNGGNDGAISVGTNVGSLINATLFTNAGVYVASNTSGSFNTLATGNYYVITVDSNYCADTANYNIAQPSVVTLSTPIINKVICNGQANGVYSTVASGGVGGYQYYISNSAGLIDSNTTGIFTGLATGVYNVQVNDANGCSAVNIGTVGDVPPIVFGNPTLTNPSCFGSSDGSICIIATGGNAGGLAYSIAVSAQGYNAGCFNSLASGTYTITAQDLLGCTATTFASLIDPTAIAINVDTVKHVNCFQQSNGSIHLSAGGGQGAPYQFSINNGPFTNGSSFGSLAAGTYTLCVKDVNNCSACTTVTITQPTLLEFANWTYTNVTCNGQSNGTITPGVAGGTAPYSVQLVIPTSPVPILLGAGATQFSGLPPGTYTVVTSDANSCGTVTTVTITEPAPLNAIADSIAHVICYGGNEGMIRVIPPTGGTPPYVYVINPTVPAGANPNEFPNLVAGTYVVNIVDSVGCTVSTGPITITQPPLLQFTNVNPTHVKCFGDLTGAISIGVTGGTKLPSGGVSRYQWSMIPNVGTVSYADSSANYTNLGAGGYLISIADARGCTSVTYVTITQNNRIKIDTFNYTPPRCFGESNGKVFVIGSGGVSPILYTLPPQYDIPNIYNQLNNLPSQTYTLTLVDAVGCTHDTVFLLPQPDSLRYADLTVTQANCEGSNDGVINATAVGGNGQYLYSVLPGVRVSQLGIFGGIPPGVYTVQVVDRLGCSTAQEVSININPNPLFVDITVVDSITCDSRGNNGTLQASASGGTAPYTYMWSTTPTPSTTSVVGNLTAGIYSVMVTDATGCTGSAFENLTGDACCNVWLPNAFSPNGDGLNDVFKAVSGADIEVINFSVRDRWGNLVFQSVDLFRGWDGRIGNIDAEVGNYYFVMTYYCRATQETITQGGDVFLTR